MSTRIAADMFLPATTSLDVRNYVINDDFEVRVRVR